MTLTLTSSCASDLAKLKASAVKQGQAAAKTQLAPLPKECDEDIPHATLSKTVDLLTTLDRERDQLTKSNDSKRRCRDYHNNQAVQLQK